MIGVSYSRRFFSKYASQALKPSELTFTQGFGSKVHLNADNRDAYNFSAGPCVLPRAVLSRAAEEMMNYKGCG
jgi:phosphoserine aminotransferase